MLVGLDMGGVRPPTANHHGDGVDSSNTNRLSSTTGEVNNGVGLHSQEVELHSLGVRRGPAVDGRRRLHNIQTAKAVTMDKHTINSRTSINIMLIIRGIPKGTRWHILSHLLGDSLGLEVREHHHFRSYSLLVHLRNLATRVPPPAGNTSPPAVKGNLTPNDRGRTTSGSHMTNILQWNVRLLFCVILVLDGAFDIAVIMSINKT